MRTDAIGRSYQAKVIAITDGDTIRVLHDGASVRIRLNGIDCPETGQAFGTRAKQFTGDLAFGQLVRLDVRDIDRYGRTVAEVTLPDGNQELVRVGLAWWYRRYARYDHTLEQLETDASRQPSRPLGRFRSHHALGLAQAAKVEHWRRGGRTLRVRMRQKRFFRGRVMV